MKKLIYVGGIIFLLSGCLRLDSNLYNNSKLNSYGFENYRGEQEITTPDSMKLSQDHYFHFILESPGVKGSSKSNIHCVYIGDPKTISKDTVILYCHGNKDHMDFYWNRAKLLSFSGGSSRFGVLMFDYRGFGLSEGTSNEASMLADVHVCTEWLKSQGMDGQRLTVYGFSLGSYAAASLASGKTGALKPFRLILEAPFASGEVMVQDASQLNMPAAYFTDVKVNNAELIRNVQQPFMWIHGEADAFLSIETHGSLVYKNYRGIYSEAHRIPGGQHGDVPAIWGFGAYMNAISDFIRNH